MQSVNEDVMIFEIRLLREEKTWCGNLEQISHYLSRILSLLLALRGFAFFLVIHAVTHRHTCNHTDLNPFKGRPSDCYTV